jgi:drug/metabolite transporter (DMT)-like permease
MLAIVSWMVIYAVVVAASILFIGRPIQGDVHVGSLLKLLLDWRFLLGGVLALGARFVFVIINNLASKHPALSGAHLTVAALATQLSILAIILANYIFLHEQLRPIQMLGAFVIICGVFLVFK